MSKASPRSKRDPRTEALAQLVEIVPSLFFKLKALTDALHAGDGLTTAERGVLRDLVERGAMTAPELAALRPVSRQAIQVVLDRLLERALIAMVENPRHRRSSLHEPTRAGVARMRVLRRREAAALARGAGAFPLEDLRRATDALARLEQLLARELED
jgi:DNA-binding MarR family transcriptional regulator